MPSSAYAAFETTPGKALTAYMATRLAIHRGASELLVREADHPALFTAPHGKAHWRAGQKKISDLNTSLLALEAARACGGRAVIVLDPADEDANWDDESRFKAIVATLLSRRPGFVLDVHGMSDKHGLDLVIGTAGDRAPHALVDFAAATAERAGLAIETRHEGSLAAGGRTLTRYVLDVIGQPALQFEWAWHMRDGKQQPEMFSIAVRVMAEIGEWTA